MSRTKKYMVAAAYLRPNMLFEEATAAWLKALDFNPSQREQKLSRHVGYIGPRTLKDYRDGFKTLGKHFSGKRLDRLTLADIREYQELRAAPGVNPNTINKELGSLIRILRTSRAWSPVMLESYVPLNPMDAEVQRALTPQEQERFLQVLASKERWSTIYWYSVLALATTMSTNELRKLRRRDFDLEQGIVRVESEGAKNKYRVRTIPLSDAGLKAARWLLDNARRIGSREPEHFIFPFRNRKNDYDPTRNSEFFVKKHFDEARRAADLPWLRPYDLRHTAITRLAEAGTPIQVIMAMAGHCSRKMSDHYTHISQQSARHAVNMAALMQADAVSPKRAERLRTFIQSAPEGGNGNNSIPVGSLIKRLQRVGLSPENILAVLSDDTGVLGGAA